MIQSPPTGESNEGLVILGRLDGAWGVHGWVRVYSWADPPETIFDYQPWLLDGHGGEVRVGQWRRSSSRLVAQLEHVSTPEQADALRHTLIRVPRQSLPELPEHQFYWRDLETLQVINADGRVLGRVESMMATGAHDVMVVDTRPATLIPFVLGHYILAVDLASGRIRVDWPAEEPVD